MRSMKSACKIFKSNKVGQLVKVKAEVCMQNYTESKTFNDITAGIRSVDQGKGEGLMTVKDKSG